MIKCNIVLHQISINGLMNIINYVILVPSTHMCIIIDCIPYWSSYNNMQSYTRKCATCVLYYMCGVVDVLHMYYMCNIGVYSTQVLHVEMYMYIAYTCITRLDVHSDSLHM